MGLRAGVGASPAVGDDVYSEGALDAFSGALSASSL